MLTNIAYEVKSFSPLIMHNNQSADPLNRYTKHSKPLKAKKKKTDEDHAEISRIDWEAGLYLSNGLVGVKGEMLFSCLLAASKRRKNGRIFPTSVSFSESFYPLTYPGLQIKAVETEEIPNPGLDKFFEGHRFVTLVRVNGSTVPSTRPYFPVWSLSFSVHLDESQMERRTLDETVVDAGLFCGLGDWRPNSPKSGGQYGRFELVKSEVLDLNGHGKSRK